MSKILLYSSRSHKKQKREKYNIKRKKMRKRKRKKKEKLYLEESQKINAEQQGISKLNLGLLVVKVEIRLQVYARSCKNYVSNRNSSTKGKIYGENGGNREQNRNVVILMMAIGMVEVATNLTSGKQKKCDKERNR